MAASYTAIASGPSRVPYSSPERLPYLYVVTATITPVPVDGLNPVIHGPPLSPADIPQSTEAAPFAASRAVCRAGPAQ